MQHEPDKDTHMNPNKVVSRILGAKTPGKKTAKFLPGKGRIILTNYKLIEGNNDPNTYILEGVIKSSTGTIAGVSPNSPGEEVSDIEGLSKKGADSRVKGHMLAILGDDLEEADDADKQVADLLRLDESGYTKKDSACPGKGLELDYSTFQRDFNGTEGTVVRFSHVKFAKPEEFQVAVQANLEYLKTLGK